MRRIIKLLLILGAIIIAIYCAFWFKISSDFADAFNQKMAGSIINITKTHRIQFSHASAGGFPFGFGVKLHDVKEDIDRAVAYHKAPVLLAYNIFSKELYMHYAGESIIDLKPLSDKKSRKSVGEFRHSVHIPIGFTTLRNIIKEPKNIGILANVQNIKFSVKNASLTDASDGTPVVKNANTNIMVMAKHHRAYSTLDEFAHDIPQDYDVTIDIANDCGSVKQDSIGLSLIYGLYIPFDLKYNLHANVHTGAKTLSPADIISDVSIRKWESNIVTNSEESHSKLSLSAKITKKDIIFDMDTLTELKTKASYSQKLADLIKMTYGIIPPALGGVKSSIRQLDFSNIDLDSKNDPVSIALKLHLNLDDKLSKVAFDIQDFGFKFRDVAFDLKNTTKGGINGQWTSGGVISVQQYETLVKYLVNTYFALHNLPTNDKFNADFYLKMFADFVHQISNNVNNVNNNATIEYELQSDITQSKLGKFSWPETTLIYYATLLKHVNKVSSNEEEALEQFKIMVPEYVVNSETMDKIITQSKE